MPPYTHVFIEGDAGTPERFWNRTFLRKNELESFAKNNNRRGFIRELTETDRKILTKIRGEKS